MATNPLELFKSVDNNPIHGTTIINHRARHKLKISCDEYVLLDLIHKLTIKNKTLSKERIKNWIGFEYEDIKPIFKSVKEKGLYEKFTDVKGITRYKVSKRYQTIHKIEMDDDYEEFWRPSNTRSWHGSKKAGKDLYKKLIDKYGSQYINAQKEAYFRYLEHPEVAWKTVMNVTTFLSLEKERFSENWNEYLKDVQRRKKPDIPETSNTVITREDIDKQFE